MSQARPSVQKPAAPSIQKRSLQLETLFPGCSEPRTAWPTRMQVGIVTPFREQEKRIQAWCEAEYGDTDRIKVGTAHKFQGDERDFVIFSPVLAQGITQHTLDWLENTKPDECRGHKSGVGLIIAGDWELFGVCRQTAPFAVWQIRDQAAWSSISESAGSTAIGWTSCQNHRLHP